jgi:hypothetical protein
MRKKFDNNTFRLLGLLFICLFIGYFFGVKNNINVTWFVLVGIISIITIIKKKKLIHKTDIILAIALMIICMTSDILMGIFVLPSYLASVLVFRDSKLKISLYENVNKHNLRNTLCLIFAVGGILAAINILISGKEFNPSIKLQWFCDARFITLGP